MLPMDVNKRTYRTGYADGPGRHTAGHPDWEAAQSKRNFERTWGTLGSPAKFWSPTLEHLLNAELRQHVLYVARILGILLSH